MSANTQDKHVVIVEDDPEMIELVKLILSKDGFKVAGAGNGHDGLHLIQELVPQVVLLDLMMPDMDGWEVYQSMKANEVMKNIPVIIITAKAQSIDKVLGLHIAKVDDYITKPFSPTELLNSVRKVMTDIPSA
jgi:DNA-binding response OmpR family regulator